MSEDLYIKFENYLSNEMPHDEKLDFENQLQNDADIREKFEIYKETTQFLAAKFDSKTNDFKQNLSSISKEHFSETKDKSKVISFKPWFYAVAACIVVALGIFTFTKSDPSYGDYQHDSAQFVERSDSDNNLKAAQDFFNAKEYQKAVSSFEKIENLSNPELQYFYAIALIETNDYAKAENLLQNIKSGTSVYKDKAAWYLALSNLKQKKFDECKVYLNQIPADAEDYTKAQKLLKDLE